MPRGALPKVYRPEMVRAVDESYSRGCTQLEIAKTLGVSQKVIFNLMRRHGIVARVAAKRDQWGPANSSWKGDEAKYAACHLRVAAVRGKPSHCEVCETTDDSIEYEWASLTGQFSDVNDYKRMCQTCHARYDNKIRNIRKDL